MPPRAWRFDSFCEKFLMVLPLSDLALTRSKRHSIGWHHGTLPNLGGLRSAKLQHMMVQRHPLISWNSLAGRLMRGKTHTVCRASTSTASHARAASLFSALSAPPVPIFFSHQFAEPVKPCCEPIPWAGGWPISPLPNAAAIC